MDGTGDLFAGFVDALGDAALPLVVSYPPDRALDYAAITEFARTRLPQDRPYVLLGESFSGPVAIALAAARPPGLLGLILCCTFARNPTPIFTLFKHVLGALPVSPSSARLAAPFLVGSGSSCALRAALGQVSAAVMRVRMRAVLEVDYSAQMRAVNVPVLYLQAAQDRLVLAGSGRHLAALAPRMQLRRLDGPHLLLQANAADSARLVKEFITSVQT
jgi:pimeloyl-[acyl-carrier protein] methyl ester esterase